VLASTFRASSAVWHMPACPVPAVHEHLNCCSGTLRLPGRVRSTHIDRYPTTIFAEVSHAIRDRAL
jgi:hypothetical protein